MPKVKLHKPKQILRKIDITDKLAATRRRPKSVSGDTLAPFYGEFLMSPSPLELSLNYCSHNCTFCFANLNKPYRFFDAAKTQRIIQRAFNSDDTSLTSYLLRNRYSVLISNHVDPFATSNYQQVLPIIELFNQLDVPIVFQTRGGRGIDAVLKYLKPSVWQISIDAGNEAIRERVQPGAPSLQSRFDLIAKLRAEGHEVVVATNPLHPDWYSLAELERDFKLFNQLGVHGIWTQLLHLSADQEHHLTEKAKQRLTPETIQTARRKRPLEHHFQYFLEVLDLAVQHNLEPYTLGYPRPSKFFEPFERLANYKTFPLYQNLINNLADIYAKHQKAVLVYFSGFLRLIGGQLPNGSFDLGHYIGSKNRGIMRQYRIPNVMPFKSLLRFIYSKPTRISPTGIPSIKHVGFNHSDGGVALVVDNEGMPILYYDIAETSELSIIDIDAIPEDYVEVK
jgi:DNA repair photolyase